MRFSFPFAGFVRFLVAVIVGLALLAGAYMIAFNAGCVPKVASPDQRTDQDSHTSGGDNSTVTSITLALTEYGPQGLGGLVLLWLGRMYGWRQQRTTNKALERVMAEIEKNRWLGTPVDNVVTGLRRFNDAVEAKIHATANKFGPSPADQALIHKREHWSPEAVEAAFGPIPRVEGATNQEAGQ